MPRERGYITRQHTTLCVCRCGCGRSRHLACITFHVRVVQCLVDPGIRTHPAVGYLAAWEAHPMMSYEPWLAVFGMGMCM